MKIIAGLGNPEARYVNTPHSVGFETADAIAASIGAAWEENRRFRCLSAGGVFAGEKVLLVKPMTYLTLSGVWVAPVVNYHNATAADLL
ncbi:MAG: peptidyl-tRNA hydrolase, partial [Kiritimatiellae bacterium]|nr:peptidyl-tRNA hydrolase [Kiritimatiellia bacterium]